MDVDKLTKSERIRVEGFIRKGFFQLLRQCTDFVNVMGQVSNNVGRDKTESSW